LNGEVGLMEGIHLLSHRASQHRPYVRRLCTQ
jgi:hypothetical protein